MENISIFKNLFKHQEDTSFDQIFKRIQNDEFKTEIEIIRHKFKEGKKEEAEKLKKALPAFTTSGSFLKGRQADLITTYSQFIILDIDKLDPSILQTVKNKAGLAPYTYCAFISPSATGIKIIVKTNSSLDQHKEAYFQICEYYEKALEINIDQSGKDVSRLCFFSYDPDIIIHSNASVFEVIQNQKEEIPFVTLPNPLETNWSKKFNEAIVFTERKSTYTEGNRNNFIHLLACNCNRRGIPKTDVLELIKSKYDLPFPEIEASVKNVYLNNSHEFALDTKASSVQINVDNITTLSFSQELNHEKVVFNAIELMAMGNLEPQYLMSPILPQKGTAVLAGKPDTGKSQFARQLCIQVAMGLKSFIDFEINPIHNRSIYVATEDNQEYTRYLMSRQMDGLNQAPKENLRFIFADTMEQEDILKELDNELIKAPADLVVVDSFGDIFKGGDSNNNMAMRNTVKIFDKIAKKHNCLILFVHHINKGAYRQAPGQEHIQGGAGLMQKVRLGIQLSEGDNNTRYFTVVKGNYCPKEYKQNSIVLSFSEETFLFSNTGKLIPTSELGTQPNMEKKEEKYSEIVSVAEKVFGNQLLSYTEFVKNYCETTGKSVPTAKRIHSQLKKLELIVEANGSYRLANPNVDTFSEDEEMEISF